MKIEPNAAGGDDDSSFMELPPAKRLPSIATLMHVLWLKKWPLLGLWLLVALPIGVLLSLYNLPRSFSAQTILRFPQVVGAQTNMMRDVAITRTESIINVFNSYQVLAGTIKRLNLQLRLETLEQFRDRVFDDLKYSEALGEGRYTLNFLRSDKVRVDFLPSQGDTEYNLFVGKLSTDRKLKVSGLDLQFSKGFLTRAKGTTLELQFRDMHSTIRELAKNLRIKPLGTVNFEVSIKDRDPWLVADMVNAVREEFLQVYYGTTEVQDVSVLVQMEKNLEHSKQRLSTSQDELAAFYNQHPSLLRDGGEKRGSEVLYIEFKSELNLAETQLRKIKNLKQAEPPDGGLEERLFWANEILGSMAEANEPKASILRGRLYKLNRDFLNQSATLGPGHPTLVATRDEITSSVQQVDEIYRGVLSRLSSEVANLKNKVAENMPVERSRPSVKVELELERLLTANKNNEETYDRLMADYNRAKLTTGSEFFKVAVVDEARPANYEPPSQKGRLLVAGAAVTALFFVFPTGFLLWQIVFLRIWSREDIQRFLDTKILGQVAFNSEAEQQWKFTQKMAEKEEAKRQRGKGKGKGKQDEEDPEPPGLDKSSNGFRKPAPVEHDPHLIYYGSGHTLQDLEAYRVLRTECLNYFGGSRETRKLCLLITSTIPGEGKTTCATNLALSFARTGRRVLLVDADLRLGRIDAMFGYETERGLIDLLKNKFVSEVELIEEASETILPTKQANLFVAPKGLPDPAAGELVGSEKLAVFLKMARNDFDVVIVDTPPVMVTADPLSLVPQVDGVVYILRSGKTPVSDAREGIEAIRDRSVKIGGILNAVSVTPFQNSRYQKYGYYYREAVAPTDVPDSDLPAKGRPSEARTNGASQKGQEKTRKPGE